MAAAKKPRQIDPRAKSSGTSQDPDPLNLLQSGELQFDGIGSQPTPVPQFVAGEPPVVELRLPESSIPPGPGTPPPYELPESSSPPPRSDPPAAVRHDPVIDLEDVTNTLWRDARTERDDIRGLVLSDTQWLLMPSDTVPKPVGRDECGYGFSDALVFHPDGAIDGAYLLRNIGSTAEPEVVVLPLGKNRENYASLNSATYTPGEKLEMHVFEPKTFPADILTRKTTYLDMADPSTGDWYDFLETGKDGKEVRSLVDVPTRSLLSIDGLTMDTGDARVFFRWGDEFREVYGKRIVGYKVADLEDDHTLTPLPEEPRAVATVVAPVSIFERSPFEFEPAEEDPFLSSPVVVYYRKDTDGKVHGVDQENVVRDDLFESRSGMFYDLIDESFNDPDFIEDILLDVRRRLAGDSSEKTVNEIFEEFRTKMSEARKKEVLAGMGDLVYEKVFPNLKSAFEFVQEGYIGRIENGQEVLYHLKDGKLGRVEDRPLEEYTNNDQLPAFSDAEGLVHLLDTVSDEYFTSNMVLIKKMDENLKPEDSRDLVNSGSVFVTFGRDKNPDGSYSNMLVTGVKPLRKKVPPSDLLAGVTLGSEGTGSGSYTIGATPVPERGPDGGGPKEEVTVVVNPQKIYTKRRNALVGAGIVAIIGSIGAAISTYDRGMPTVPVTADASIDATVVTARNYDPDASVDTKRTLELFPDRVSIDAYVQDAMAPEDATPVDAGVQYGGTQTFSVLDNMYNHPNVLEDNSLTFEPIETKLPTFYENLIGFMQEMRKSPAAQKGRYDLMAKALRTFTEEHCGETQYKAGNNTAPKTFARGVFNHLAPESPQQDVVRDLFVELLTKALPHKLKKGHAYISCHQPSEE